MGRCDAIRTLQLERYQRRTAALQLELRLSQKISALERRPKESRLKEEETSSETLSCHELFILKRTSQIIRGKMSKLNVDQKTIIDLFSDKKADFIIPDYQRPYAWNEEQCQTLWDDIFSFSFPDNNCDEFDKNEEYFLGSIVTYSLST